jgi:hypothetical protein
MIIKTTDLKKYSIRVATIKFRAEEFQNTLGMHFTLITGLQTRYQFVGNKITTLKFKSGNICMVYLVCEMVFLCGM